MKRLIILGVTLLIASVLTGVALTYATDRYIKNQQNKPTPVASITVAESDKKVAAAKTAAATKYQALVNLYNLETAECAKGKVAYDKLTNTLKNTTPAPICGQAIELTSPAE